MVDAGWLPELAVIALEWSGWVIKIPVHLKMTNHPLNKLDQQFNQLSLCASYAYLRITKQRRQADS
jgi:hypothetical protein